MLIPFNELFKRHQIQTSGVLHLGASLGQEADAYNAHGIGRVVWVEAIPDIYNQLCVEIARFPGHQALLGCLAETDGTEVVFHVASNGGQSSSYLEFGTHATAHPNVHFVRDIKMTTVRVDTLLRENQVHVGPGWFLNVDLQGAELGALRSMGDLLYRFDHAYIEVNEKELYKGCPLVKEIDDYLAQYGFVGKEVKMTGWGWGDKYYAKK